LFFELRVGIPWEFRDFVQIGHDRRAAACKSFLETGTFKTAGPIPVTIADIEEAGKRKQVQIPLLMKFIKDRMSFEKEAEYLVSFSAFNCTSDSPAKLKNELREKKRALDWGQLYDIVYNSLGITCSGVCELLYSNPTIDHT
jgi:hypothetical protein